MPPRNTIREFFTDSYYHTYNRGAGKSTIFEDKLDYATFLHLLKKYLEPNFKQEKIDRTSGEAFYETPDHVYKEVDLMAFCLMPNHFHLLVKDKTASGVTKLMLRVISSYVTYFNKKYGLSGRLFQGVYRAVRIATEDQLLYVSRYIHRNPRKLLKVGEVLNDYSHSSYPTYLGYQRLDWLHSEDVLQAFSTSSDYKNSYQKFVEEHVFSEEQEDPLKVLLLDQG